MPMRTSMSGREPGPDEDDELNTTLERDEGEDEENEDDRPPRVEGEESDVDIEARARRSGWLPEDEWDDDRAKAQGRKKPKTWFTARQWVDRVDADNVALRGRNRALDSELKATKETANRTAGQVTELTKLVENLLDTQKKLGQRAYDKARRELQEKMDGAVEESNPDAYKAAKDGLKQLDEERAETEAEMPKPTPKPPADAAPQIDPVVLEWAAANPWYDADPQARALAVSIHGQLLAEHKDWTLSQNLAEVRARVADRFPEHFENPRRNEPGRVSRPSGDQGKRSTKVTFNDLSAEQKDTYDRQARFFKAKGVTYTKEEFLSDQLLG